MAEEGQEGGEVRGREKGGRREGGRQVVESKQGMASSATAGWERNSVQQTEYSQPSHPETLLTTFSEHVHRFLREEDTRGCV